IRTSDHLHPMQVRYRAALRPEQIFFHEIILCCPGCLIVYEQSYLHVVVSNTSDRGAKVGKLFNVSSPRF
ncbi:MAG: hypothetical protein ABI855_16820, partial [Bacteroidota bacterium]